MPNIPASAMPVKFCRMMKTIDSALRMSSGRPPRDSVRISVLSPTEAKK